MFASWGNRPIDRKEPLGVSFARKASWLIYRVISAAPNNESRPFSVMTFNAPVRGSEKVRRKAVTTTHDSAKVCGKHRWLCKVTHRICSSNRDTRILRFSIEKRGCPCTAKSMDFDSYFKSSTSGPSTRTTLTSSNPVTFLTRGTISSEISHSSNSNFLFTTLSSSSPASFFLRLCKNGHNFLCPPSLAILTFSCFSLKCLLSAFQVSCKVSRTVPARVGSLQPRRELYASVP